LRADAYSASKAGVAGLVGLMAADYAADAVRVNGVLPGITETSYVTGTLWAADGGLTAV
jgi:NAD(P)-dependent dehydrogenase (short-subunit alcohol dehydrogenase family)